MSVQAPPDHLRNPTGAAICLSFTAGLVEMAGLLGLHGFLPVHIVVDAPLALLAVGRAGEPWIARALAIPVFIIVTTLLAATMRRSKASLRLITGYLLFFQCLMLLAAMALGVILGPFASVDQPAAVAAALVLVSAMAFQTLGASTLWRDGAGALILDWTGLVARLGGGDGRPLGIIPRLVGLAAFILGAATEVTLWPVAGFWSLALAAAMSFVALLNFVPFDLSRAAEDFRRR
ncbi:MAG: hypothetical protein J7521_04670 [Caulobacter sp.]|nr:hypothetical protein [Caulobacter sp.]